MTRESPPTRQWRIAVACVVGLSAGAYAIAFRRGRVINADFDQIWIAARALLAGDDPYHAVATRFNFPFYYPLTAAVVGLPFASLPIGIAAALWSTLGLGILAYALTMRGPWGLIYLANYPALEAAIHGQWTPLITASALIPSLAWVAAAKPTSGLAVAVAYLHRTARGRAFIVNFIVVVGLFAVAFYCWPSWPHDWLTAVLAARQHVVPLIRRPGGFLLALAALRWRRPEARMILFLALVPQTASLYEALPLILALTTTREAIVFGALTLVASTFDVAPLSSNAAEFGVVMAHNAVVNLLLVYLPTLLLVLRRPNEGALPWWIEQSIGWLPPWLRGQSPLSSASVSA